MNYCKSNVSLCCFTDSKTIQCLLSFRDNKKAKLIVVSVFCACLISAMGNLAGMRQILMMQFNVDVNTEFIAEQNAVFFQKQLSTLKKK